MTRGQSAEAARAAAIAAHYRDNDPSPSTGHGSPVKDSKGNPVTSTDAKGKTTEVTQKSDVRGKYDGGLIAMNVGGMAMPIYRQAGGTIQDAAGNVQQLANQAAQAAQQATSAVGQVAGLVGTSGGSGGSLGVGPSMSNPLVASGPGVGLLGQSSSTIGTSMGSYNSLNPNNTATATITSPSPRSFDLSSLDPNLLKGYGNLFNEGGAVYAQVGGEMIDGQPAELALAGAPPVGGPPMAPPMAPPMDPAMAPPPAPMGPPPRKTFAEKVAEAREAIQGGQTVVPETMPMTPQSDKLAAYDGQMDGPVDMYPGSGELVPGMVGPDVGPDDVDAMVEEGSYVMNAEGSDMFADEIEAMYKGGMVNGSY